MRYDYEFLYQTKCVLSKMRMRAKAGLPMTAFCIQMSIWMPNTHIIILTGRINSFIQSDSKMALYIRTLNGIEG